MLSFRWRVSITPEVADLDRDNLYICVFCRFYLNFFIGPCCWGCNLCRFPQFRDNTLDALRECSLLLVERGKLVIFNYAFFR